MMAIAGTEVVIVGLRRKGRVVLLLRNYWRLQNQAYAPKSGETMGVVRACVYQEIRETTKRK
jgi:hypothetical protein